MSINARCPEGIQKIKNIQFPLSGSLKLSWGRKDLHERLSNNITHLRMHVTNYMSKYQTALAITL